MSETTFEKQILSKLDKVERTMSHILEYIEDTKLTAEERQLLQESIKQEREGKLISHKDLLPQRKKGVFRRRFGLKFQKSWRIRLGKLWIIQTRFEL